MASHFLYGIASCILLAGAAVGARVEDNAEPASVKQVAIIGAGAGGSSTAFHLARFAEQSSLPINITIFESTSRIGGRTLTVNAHDDPSFPIELGASIFVDVCLIMTAAVREFGLSVTEYGVTDDEKGFMGVWDGERFVYEQDDHSWKWWTMARLFWKYGLAPYKARELMKRAMATFLKLYEPPYFPFRSLSQKVFELGLEKLTAVTGTQYLMENGVGNAFAHDLVQASTRVNYASNLDYIHGMEAMVSLAPEGAVSVQGGNWRIFSAMIESCKVCTVYQNTAATRIDRAPQKSALERPKYLVTTQASSAEGEPETHPFAFDAVIIAAPWQFANITTGPDVLQHVIDAVPYMRLHVTLFTSPLRLSKQYFGVRDDRIPTEVLTTLGSRDEPHQGGEGVGSPGFYAISTLKKMKNPKTGQDEFCYKIFSARKVTPDFLGELFDTEIPPEFVGSADGPITWYFPHVFWSYPVELPRVTFQDPVLADGLFYTSGIESFISTMETSALMGKNVARLITDDFGQDAARGRQGEDVLEEILVEDSKVVGEAGEMKGGANNATDDLTGAGEL